MPEPTFQFRSLRSLCLSNNALEELSPRLFELSGLEELDVGYNRKIATIDNSISKLQSLGTLVLCGNSLMALPDSIGELKGLNSLNVSFNRLGSLPAFLSKVNGR